MAAINSIIPALLQWGHDFDVVEDETAADHLRRRLRGFNGATTLTSWKTPRAPEAATRTVTLQWGHDFDVVEDEDLAAEGDREAVLQWGHDFDVVEDEDSL